MTKLQRLLCIGVSLLLFLCFISDASAAPLIPNVNIDVGSSDNPQDVAVTLQLMAVLTILSIAPSILIMTTAFIRIGIWFINFNISVDALLYRFVTKVL